MVRTRGIRNKNPFNIKLSSNSWLGKVNNTKNTDEFFEQFRSVDYGLRSGIILLQNYIKHGYNTPSCIISRFAPSCENNTERYLSFVCGYMFVAPNTEIDNIDYFYLLCAAICYYESKYTFSRPHFDTILQNFNIHLNFDF